MSSRSMPSKVQAPGALDAYEAIADCYDVLTHDYRHDVWLDRLEGLAVQHGLRGNRLLDVGCGTGKSFLPMLARGYEVTACDISPSMLVVARNKAPGVPLYEADLRGLPVFGSFDLVTALDDPLNYLLTEREFVAALRGIGRNLDPDGLAIFDLNTLAQYRGQFAHDATIEREAHFIVWRGDSGNREASGGQVVEATVEVFTATREDTWRRISSVHRQRHWPRSTVERLAREAGLRVLTVRGQRPGAKIDQTLNELVHIKAIYVACAGRKEQA